MYQLHIANIIQIDLVFEYDDKPLPVQSHAQDSRRKCELAYGRVSLRVGYDEAAGRKNEGDQRRAEQHLEQRDISNVGAVTLRERIGVEYAKSSCRTFEVSLGQLLKLVQVACGRIPTAIWL